ncbi:MAG: ABC transporter ATP-binding protein [Planctomycetota bacterium]|nr:ABC transporter ATP-binding protein [Planctomycetota bacterium]
MIRLTIHNLRLVSDGLILLDDIRLEAKPGTIHLIIGPTGSGKTLLGRTLAGFEPDSSGEIYLDGRDVIDIPAARRRIGWVAKSNSLWPALSVYSNVEFGLKSLKNSRQERKTRVSEALGWFGADSLKQQRADSLTKVESRRVELARALIVDPQIMIIDEPLNGLQPEESETLCENIARVQSDQRLTTLILTRDPQPWLPFTDRISLLDLGKILQTGPVAEVLQRPNSIRSAEFFGGCNILDGEIEAIGQAGEVLVRLALGQLVGRLSVTTSTPEIGSPVQVLIRPEAIALGMAPSGGGQSNRVPVRLENIAFNGPTRRIRMTAPGEQILESLATATVLGGLSTGSASTALIPADQVSVITI